MSFADLTLLEKQGRVTPKDDKTNIFLDFNVPNGVEKLIIDYSYSPKTVENRAEAVKLISEGLEKYLGKDNNENPLDYLPVKNLITLSLDSNGNYRGAAHRQDDVQHHEISKDFASNGFLKGKIESGVWRVVLNVHCCACEVSYSLKVSGEAEV